VREFLNKRRGGKILPLAFLAAALAACGGNDEEPRPGEVAVFDAIDDSEVITVLGTEPFWNARIEGVTLTYSTPENINGTQVSIERFAGNGGLGISGELDGVPLQLAITPGECSDSMSDRSYPYTATLALGGESLLGCAYTDLQGFSGEENP
jgi:uncharacterized membrane protein